MAVNRRDEAILKFLDERDVILPPKPLYENLLREGATFSYKTVSRRLRYLEDLGLVERALEEEGYYGITEKGRRYLAGEIEAEDLEPDNG